jgi:uncharacterized damage-inducible protein DinB
MPVGIPDILLFCIAKYRHMKKLLQTCAMSLLALTLGWAPARTQAVTEEDIKAQLVKEWERAKVFTVEYLNTMPADKYGYKVQDSIRNFAQQMLHLAGGNVFLMMNATDETPPAGFSPALEQRASAQTKDSVMAFVTQSYDYCIAAVKSLPVSRWGETKKLFSFTETRFALIIKTFEHQTHHRGQTTIYIRAVGVKPPQEKLFQ